MEVFFFFFLILAGDGAINFEEFSKLVKSPKLRLDRSKKPTKKPSRDVMMDLMDFFCATLVVRKNGMDWQCIGWSRFLPFSLFQKDVGLRNL